MGRIIVSLFLGLLSCVIHGQIIQATYLVSFQPNVSLGEKIVERITVTKNLKTGELISMPEQFFRPTFPYGAILREDKLNRLQLVYNKWYQMDQPIHLEWKLLPEKKVISNYTCQKAVTKYGGRTWEAWFAPQETLSHFPYIFSGLPGSIIELKALDNTYRFSLIGSKEVVNMPRIPSPVLISAQKFLEISKNVRAKPEQLFWILDQELSAKGLSMSIGYEGKQFSKAEQAAKVADDFKKWVTKYNNPPEKDSPVLLP